MKSTIIPSILIYNNIVTPPLTPSEQSVIQRLRRWRVATKAALCKRLHCCHMTVVRALKKTGYHNSFNANAAYYTLPQTPAFDPHGLWFHRHIGFSRHGNLLQTLVALVQNAPAGCTVAELEARLSTPVANLLCRLRRQGRIAVVQQQRHALYLASDPAEQRRQLAQRQNQSLAPPLRALAPRPALPAGVGAQEVIALLITLIQHPKARPPTLVHRLQQRGVNLSLAKVRQIEAFYELQKKTAR